MATLGVPGPASYNPPASTGLIGVADESPGQTMNTDGSEYLWWRFEPSQTGWILFDAQKNNTNGYVWHVVGHDRVDGAASGPSVLVRVIAGQTLYIGVYGYMGTLVLRSSEWATFTKDVVTPAHDEHIVVTVGGNEPTSAQQTLLDASGDRTTFSSAEKQWAMSSFNIVGFDGAPTPQSMVRYMALGQHGALFSSTADGNPNPTFADYVPKPMVPAGADPSAISPIADKAVNLGVAGPNAPAGTPHSVYSFSNSVPDAPSEVYYDLSGRSTSIFPGLEVSLAQSYYQMAQTDDRFYQPGHYYYWAQGDWVVDTQYTFGPPPGYLPSPAQQMGVGSFYEYTGWLEYGVVAWTISLAALREDAIASLPEQGNLLTDGTPEVTGWEVTMNSWGTDSDDFYGSRRWGLKGRVFIRPSMLDPTSPRTSLADRGSLLGTFDRATDPAWHPLSQELLDVSFAVEADPLATNTDAAYPFDDGLKRGLMLHVEADAATTLDATEVELIPRTLDEPSGRIYYDNRWLYWGAPVFRLTVAVPEYYNEVPVRPAIPPDEVVEPPPEPPPVYGEINGGDANSRRYFWRSM